VGGWRNLFSTLRRRGVACFYYYYYRVRRASEMMDLAADGWNMTVKQRSHVRTRERENRRLNRGDCEIELQIIICDWILVLNWIVGDENTHAHT